MIKRKSKKQENQINMPIMLDANVIVSSLIKRNSKPALMMNSLLEDKVQLVIDKHILIEYNEVLYRLQLNIPFERAKSVLQFITFSAVWVHFPAVEFDQKLIIVFFYDQHKLKSEPISIKS